MSSNRRDALLITQVMKALDVKYRLAEKMAQEPGLKDIIQQFIGRIEHAFGSLAYVKGKRILDIACGSNTSDYSPCLKTRGFYGLDTDAV